MRLTEVCATAGVEVLDAPVSGGRLAAEEHRLTTIVGGPRPVAERCEKVFASFSRHVVHLGVAGAGQTAKLFNNALLMLNQAAIVDIVDLATELKLNVPQLVEALKLGSASSAALTLLNTMVTPDTVEHLSAVQVLDMELFDQAMGEAGIDSAAVTARGLTGARELPDLVGWLNPEITSPVSNGQKGPS
ncbi:NAD(P)-binding domain-containing protein [Streptomyces sp.]|uniref:NAD(P)-binding domain-containing protein n=1 Tax=Streptomyces sp. TaxID=1931 RepID=UPI002D783C1D|nr:NAD(P)-binding domain-containing protein [Streptomyces sp.]HET6354753.1 NAD(P)-binding domain-containing protein [Streptomyces sp.]